jgi:glycosyltransferase involved in cell wall biosynthesis
VRAVLVYRSRLLGSSETFIRDQVSALKRFKPTLVGRHPIDGLDLQYLETTFLDCRSVNRVCSHFSNAWQMLQLPRPLAVRKLRRLLPSLIHAHFGIDGVEVAPYARQLDLPLIITLHGHDITKYRWWWEQNHGGRHMRSYPKKLIALSASRSVHMISVSEAIRDAAIEFGISREKITTIHTGVDTNRFRPSGLPIEARKPRVLFVGRLVEKKGCKILLDAMTQVQRDVPNCELVIVGDGPLRKHLEDFAKEKNINCRFTGNLPAEGVKQELDQARLLCLPSLRAANGDDEGFGMVLLEAQASGVPVVTSARGGSTEGLVNGKTGFAFEPGDISELKNRVTRLLIEDELAHSMSWAARTFVAQHFDLHACTSRLDAYYDEVIARHKTNQES